MGVLSLRPGGVIAIDHGSEGFHPIQCVSGPHGLTKVNRIAEFDGKWPT
jgi:hypothetical protein